MSDAMAPVLADPNVRRYVLARVVSVAGSGLSYVLLPVLVYSLTGSAAWTAAMTAAETLPYLLFGLGAGALADRVNRKRMMVVADVISAVGLVTIPIAYWADLLHPAHVLAVGLLTQTVFVFFDAANSGALPSLVDRRDLPRANAVLWGASTVADTAVPPLAGVALVALAAAPLLLVDVASYAASALLVLAITRPLSRARSTAERGSLTGDIRAGLGFLFRHPVVRTFTVLNMLASVAGGAFMAMFLVWADLRLHVRAGDWRLSALYLGWGLGSVLGSLVSARFVAWVGPTKVPLYGLPTVAVVIVLAVLAPTWWLGAIGMLAWGASYMVIVLNTITVRQQVTPEEMMSRVTTSGRMLSVGVGYTGGAALAGLLAGPLGYEWAMLIGGLACVIAAIFAWFSPLRRMGPDAIVVADSPPTA